LLKVLESKPVGGGHPTDKEFRTPRRVTHAKPALVRVTPPLPDDNRFSALGPPEPGTASDLEDTPLEVPEVQPPPAVEPRRLRQPKWERRMAPKLVDWRRIQGVLWSRPTLRQQTPWKKLQLRPWLILAQLETLSIKISSTKPNCQCKSCPNQSPFTM